MLEPSEPERHSLDASAVGLGGVGVDGHPGRGPAASGEGGVTQRAAVAVFPRRHPGAGWQGSWWLPGTRGTRRVPDLPGTVAQDLFVGAPADQPLRRRWACWAASLSELTFGPLATSPRSVVRRPTSTSTSSTRWRLVGAASVRLSPLTERTGVTTLSHVAFAGMSSCASHRATFQSRSAMPWPDHARRRQLP